MAHTKSGGSTSNLRDSKPKYLGVKLFGGQIAKVGDIIIRQRGTKFLPGKNVKLGADDTIYAVKNGIVQFKTKKRRGFNNKTRVRKIVNIISK